MVDIPKQKSFKKCFLLYANTTAQFEHLMQMSSCPEKNP